MKRLFFICLLVTLTGISGANKAHATEANTAEETETEIDQATETTEKTVVTFSEPEENTEKTVEESTEPVTIQQMKDNLEELKTEKEVVGNKWAELSQVNGKILDFLKEELNDEDIQAIKTLSLDFQQRQSFYEQQLKDNAEENFNTSVEADNDTAAVKDNFIQYKLNFYKNLVPYVNTVLKDEYLEYIRGNIALEQEEKTIKEKIYKQEEVIEERVETIKEKIKEHKEQLEEKLEKLIREKIQGKIDDILTRPAMESLSDNRKIQILNAVAIRLEETKQRFIQKNIDTEYTRKKIAIYNVVIEVVYEKIESQKQ